MSHVPVDQAKSSSIAMVGKILEINLRQNRGFTDG